MTCFLGWGPERPLPHQVSERLLHPTPVDVGRLQSLLASRLGGVAEHYQLVDRTRKGVAAVAERLPLAASDEVLASDHEYPESHCDWLRAAERRGFHYRQFPLGLPVSSHAHFLNQLEQALQPGTRVLYFSHITCLTALKLPVAEICQLARSRGVLTVIDGAHAVGQVELDLGSLQADFYCACLHKWLGGAEPCGFVYAPKPLALPPPAIPRPGVWSASEVALQIFEPPRRGSELAQKARQLLADWSGLAPLQPAGPEWTASMVAVALPHEGPPLELQSLLLEEGFCVNIHEFQGKMLLRLCLGEEDREEDVVRLVGHLDRLVSLKFQRQV